MPALDSFDVVVVGGGWGGLATGALLAQRGARVLLLESRGACGGRASYQERDGFLLDYGIHAHRFGKAGEAAALYEALGEKLDLVTPRRGTVFHRGKHHAVRHKPYQVALSGVVSTREKAALASALRGLAARDPAKLWDVPLARMIPLSTGADSRRLISALSGFGLISEDLNTTSAGEFAAFLRKAARSRFLISFPRGGCHQHVRRLSALIARSGEVRTGTRVRGVTVESGVVGGVDCADGRVSAGVVVLALPAPAAARLVGEGVLADSSREKMSKIVPTAGLTWEVGLARPVSEADTAFCTDPLIIGAFPSNFDHLLAPPGKQLATFCMPLPLSAFDDPDGLRREASALRRKAFHMFGRLEENILWERAMKLPMIDGAVPSVSQPWPARPGLVADGVEGLFLAGDTVGVPGQGGDVAFRSALECAPLVMDYLG